MEVIKEKIKIKTIFRVENRYGLGPYRHGMNFYSAYDIVSKHEYDGKHPVPMYDLGINRQIKPYEICGFLNLEQLYKWFTKQELEDLKNVGFDIVEIKVKEITAIGEYQVLAIPRGQLKYE